MVVKDPGFLHGVQQRLWSDWVDAQADLSLRWVHRSFCLFYHAPALIIKQYLQPTGLNLLLLNFASQPYFSKQTWFELHHGKTGPGGLDQVRLKPACSATEASYSLESLKLASIGIILSRKQTAKALIRLYGRAGWSVPLLFAYGKNGFSGGVAHLHEALSIMKTQSSTEEMAFRYWIFV